MKYEPIPSMSREEIETAIGRDSPSELSVAVLSAALNSTDPSWAESVCVRLSIHPDPGVRGNAILGLGHIARLHGALQAHSFRAIAEARADPHPYVRGHAESAADDVEVFLDRRIPKDQA
jgi:hypothetical protein